MTANSQKLTTPAILSQEVRYHIDHWLEKYPSDKKQSAVIAALMIVQTENSGWLSVELMDAVAAYLGMPKIAVYEVATFYTMFELKPVGEIKISVCTNVSCMLCDSDKIIKHLKKKLGIKVGETTVDGKFTLKAAECLAACGMAPVMQVNREYYGDLTPQRVDEILLSLEEYS